MKSSTDPVVLSSFSNGEEAVEYVICCDEGSEIQSSAEFDQSCERQVIGMHSIFNFFQLFLICWTSQYVIVFQTGMNSKSIQT